MADLQMIAFSDNIYDAFDMPLYGSPLTVTKSQIEQIEENTRMLDIDTENSSWSSSSSTDSQETPSPSSNYSTSIPGHPPASFPLIHQRLASDENVGSSPYQVPSSTTKPEEEETQPSTKSSRRKASKLLAAFLPPCRICGEKASGFHYGANTCEACKGFFRRSLQRGIKYRCLGTGNCAILPGRRSSCAACRFDKCIAIGMSKTAIRTGRYTHAKRAKDIAEVKRLEQEQEMKQAGLLVNTSQEKEFEYESLSKHLADAYASSSVYSDSFIETVPMCEAKYLEKKKLKEELFGPMDPVPFDVYYQIYSSTGIDIDGRKEFAKRLIPIMEASITRFIQFAKLIPGFKELPSNDQISLLKAARYDCWLLAAHRAVNIEQGLYTNMGGCTMSIKDMVQLEQRDYVDTFFKLCGFIKKLNLSHTESAVLQAISMMCSDRCTLENPEKVQQCQYNLVDTLQHYLQKHHPEDPRRLARLLLLLTDLRLAEVAKSQQDKVMLSMGDLQFPPLLLEMWSC